MFLHPLLPTVIHASVFHMKGNSEFIALTNACKHQIEFYLFRTHRIRKKVKKKKTELT